MKHKIANFLRKKQLTDSCIYRMLAKLNALVFHKELQVKKKTYGNRNPEKTFYVIRRNNQEDGLISIFFSIAKEVEYAIEKGYIPFVDLQNYQTQYRRNESVQGTYNAWEYYFKQPFSEYSIQDIYQSKNVILGDCRKGMGKITECLENYDFHNNILNETLYYWMTQHMKVQDYIYNDMEKIREEKFKGKEIIGVFIRGTDYVAFMPKGHSIQPDKKIIKKEILKLKEKYENAAIFIVTEDENIYSYLSDYFKSDLIQIEDIRFSNYKGDDYIAKYCKNNSYEIGYIYLIKLLLLAKCNYLIASITNGSKFANIMNGNQYEERIIIDLGVYK